MFGKSSKSITINDIDTIVDRMRGVLEDFCLTDEGKALRIPDPNGPPPCEDILRFSTERSRGNLNFETNNYLGALSSFETLACRYPFDPAYRVDVGRCLVKLRDYEKALSHFKSAITLARKAERITRTRLAGCESDLIVPAVSNSRLSYACYAGMGEAYEGLDRASKAVNCYVLAMKFARQCYNFPFPLSEGDIDASSRLSCLLPPPAVPIGGGGAIDIEDTISLYTPSSPFTFSCTMCGECCRSSDHILLSPMEIFLLSRWGESLR